MARGLALVAGLRAVDPAAYGGWDGQNGCWGCELDVDNVGRILRSQGLQVHELKTKDATASNILRSLASAAANLAPEDLFVFYFSGHGGQQPDLDGDELDGQDETLVAYDREIIDDELNKVWPQFRSGVRIVMLSDSCNSGTNYKNRGRFDAPSPFVPVLDKAVANEMRAQMIHIGGCRDGFSSTGYLSGGAFTTALCDAWSGGTFRGGYVDLYNSSVGAVTTGQRPQYNEYGPVTEEFRKQRPFSVAGPASVRVECSLEIHGVDLDRAQEILNTEAGPCLVSAFGEALAKRSGEVSASCSAESGGHWSCEGSVTIRF